MQNKRASFFAANSSVSLLAGLFSSNKENNYDDAAFAALAVFDHLTFKNLTIEWTNVFVLFFFDFLRFSFTVADFLIFSIFGWGHSSRQRLAFIVERNLQLSSKLQKECWSVCCCCCGWHVSECWLQWNFRSIVVWAAAVCACAKCTFIMTKFIEKCVFCAVCCGCALFALCGII